ncbi:MAG: hypothetical protein SGILL_002461 [Bacillariaceae sp.]
MMLKKPAVRDVSFGSLGLSALQESDSLNISDLFSAPHFKSKHPDAIETCIAFASRIRDSTHPKMIVFDKDGTLGDCTSSLRRWVFFMAEKVRGILVVAEEEKIDEILQEFYDGLGWNITIDNVNPSAPVAAGTWDGIVTIVYEFLVKHKDKCSMNITLDTVQRWHRELGNLHGQDAPVVDDLRGILMKCQAMGYLVAVCTSDDRAATSVALRSWNIDDLVSVMICGDEVSQGKPSPAPLYELCDRTNEYLQKEQLLQDSGAPIICSQDCIMVGDTSADTGMARAANAGFCIGVLTGSGTTEQLLDTGAQLVVPDVTHKDPFNVVLIETLRDVGHSKFATQYFPTPQWALDKLAECGDAAKLPSKREQTDVEKYQAAEKAAARARVEAHQHAGSHRKKKSKNNVTKIS